MALSFLVWHFLSFFLSQLGWSYPTPVDFDGQILRWQKSVDDAVVFYQVESKEDLKEAYQWVIDEAASLWSDVPTSFIQLRPIDADQDESPMITIKLSSQIKNGSFSSGFAIFDEKNERGPVHCTMEILVDGSGSLNSISKTILHEFGHCLGLGHSIFPESIMSYELTKNRFALDIDDMAAISRLYPADGSPPGLAMGCAVGAHRRSVGIWGVVLLILPIGLSVLKWCIYSVKERS